MLCIISEDYIHCYASNFCKSRARSESLSRARRNASDHQRAASGNSPALPVCSSGSGEVIPVGRGLYRLANAPALTNPDWIKVGLRIPRAVICLISALAHYELTTQVPHYVDIALQSHAQIPKVDGVPVRVFWFPPRAFEAGVQTVNVDRVPIKIYSPEKTIADCFKYRNKVGIDVAIEALP